MPMPLLTASTQPDASSSAPETSALASSCPRPEPPCQLYAGEVTDCARRQPASPPRTRLPEHLLYAAHRASRRCSRTDSPNCCVDANLSNIRKQAKQGHSFKRLESNGCGLVSRMGRLHPVFLGPASCPSRKKFLARGLVT